MSSFMKIKNVETKGCPLLKDSVQMIPIVKFYISYT